MIVNGLVVGSVDELLQLACGWENEANFLRTGDMCNLCRENANRLLEEALALEEAERACAVAQRWSTSVK